MRHVLRQIHVDSFGVTPVVQQTLDLGKRGSTDMLGGAYIRELVLGCGSQVVSDITIIRYCALARKPGDKVKSTTATQP